MHKPEQEFYPYGVKAPCINCPKIGCGPYHTKCEKYKQYRTNLEQSKKRNKELAEILSFRGVKGCYLRGKLTDKSTNYQIHKITNGGNDYNGGLWQ